MYSYNDFQNLILNFQEFYSGLNIMNYYGTGVFRMHDNGWIIL